MKLLVAALVIALPTFAEKKPKSKPPSGPQTVRMADQTVTTPLGDFTFSTMTLSPEIYLGMVRSNLRLQGLSTNGTGKKWEHIAFSGIFANSAGKEVDREYFTFFKMAAGQSMQLSSMPEGSIVFLREPVASFTIKYDSGTPDVSYSLKLRKPAESDELQFSDEFVALAFSVGRNGLNFALLNKTDEPIKIDWNQISFIDWSADAHPVTHTGVKYTDAAAAKPASIVPPSAKFKDAIIPADNVHFTSGQYGGWSVNDLLPHTTSAPTLKGKDVAVYMPLEVNGKTKNYTFQFQIIDVFLN